MLRRVCRLATLVPIILLLLVAGLTIVPSGTFRADPMQDFEAGLFQEEPDGIEPLEEGEESGLNPASRYVSDRPWLLGTTGWVAIGNDPMPKRDNTFQGHDIALGGRPYPKGIGVFPFSEVLMELDEPAAFFRATVGIEDGVAGPAGSVRFHVFVDDALVTETGVLRAGQPPRPLQVPVAGGQLLRLVVTDGEDGTEGDFAVWADARLIPGDTAQRERAARALAEVQARVGAQRRANAGAVANRLQRRAADDLRTIAAAVGPDLGAGQPRAGLDRDGQRLVFANGRIAALLGFGGDQNGVLTVLRLPSGEPVLSGLAPAVLGDDLTLSLRRDTVPQGRESYSVAHVTDPGLGDSLELAARYRLRQGAPQDAITVRLRLSTAAPALVYQVDLLEIMAAETPRLVRYLDAGDGAAVSVAGDVRYVTDYSQVREGTVADDGLWRRDVVGLGKPLVVWSRDPGHGLLLAGLDEVDLPARLLLRRDLGAPTAAIGLEQPLPDTPSGRLPRLYLEALDTPRFPQTIDGYRQVVARLYPPLPVPSWVKYQWLSWYVYNTDIADTDIKRQIDYIAEHAGDMGPWNVLVDAGWYISEGREGAEWRAVDREKFPLGLRELVDYAHARGVRVVLYFSSPFLDDNASPRNWLGLRGIIDEHPEWLIPLEPDGDVRRFVYDYANPELRAYLAEVMRDFLVEYGVDGMKLDGLGGGEGQIIAHLFSGNIEAARQFLGQTMEVYRHTYQAIRDLGVPDFYIESGWVSPVFAHPYAHMFRYGDEYPAFSHAYPFPGLKEHIEYGQFQHLLGQRGNVGAIYLDPNQDPLALWWLEASLATGMQTTLSFDLPGMTPETLSAVRERLVPFTAFRNGVTRLGPGWPAETFSTTVEGTTYLGILNGGPTPKTYDLTLADYGLNPERNHLVYVVDRKRFVPARDHLTVRLPGQSFRLLVIRTAPGMMWTNSSFQVQRERQQLTVQVQGPTIIDGFVKLYVPRSSAVLLDGEEISAGPEAGQYQYDNRTRVLSVAYPHDAPHTITVRWGPPGT